MFWVDFDSFGCFSVVVRWISVVLGMNQGCQRVDNFDSLLKILAEPGGGLPPGAEIIT